MFDDREHPDDLGEQGGRLGARTEVGGHGVHERVGVVENQRHQPVDAIAPRRQAGRPLVHEGTPLPLQNRVQLSGALFGSAFVECAHESPSVSGPASDLAWSCPYCLL
ncbi:hypothetical protein A5620_25370 [Mycobacterium colombiense]|nr:hypothetical protein A5620_25370 [Mycobacterium colombiense]